MEGSNEQRIQEVQAKAWRGEYEGADGAIDGAEKLVADGAWDTSALASMYYSAAGALQAAGNTDDADTYAQKAADFSDTFAAEKEANGETLTPDEADVRQSILRRVGRFDDAYTVITEARAAHADMPQHTNALLHIGEMEVHTHNDETDAAQEHAERVVDIAEEVTHKDPKQGIRLFRALARFYKNAHEAEMAQRYADRARELIKEANGAADDQLAKLNADMQ